jgi:hypothetical protein
VAGCRSVPLHWALRQRRERAWPSRYSVSAASDMSNPARRDVAEHEIVFAQEDHAMPRRIRLIPFKLYVCERGVLVPTSTALRWAARMIFGHYRCTCARTISPGYWRAGWTAWRRGRPGSRARASPISAALTSSPARMRASNRSRCSASNEGEHKSVSARQLMRR